MGSGSSKKSKESVVAAAPATSSQSKAASKALTSSSTVPQQSSDSSHPASNTTRQGGTKTATVNQTTSKSPQEPAKPGPTDQKTGHSPTATQDSPSPVSSGQAKEADIPNQPKKMTTKAELANATVKPGDSGKWQDADVSDLFAALSLDDRPDRWSDHIDLLMSQYDSRIKPEHKRNGWKTVRLFVSSTFKDMSNEREFLVPDLRNGWKTVRLFVSSTFKDMSNEREFLVKKIFPQLRQWCEERKLRLVECDLRWGVPKDADTRETLLACLSEIDRCREENVYPYFLNLMSERYGWVPKPHEVPEDIKAKYKWIPGMSATAAEVMIGGYWDRNIHSLYMLRNSDCLKSIKDEKALKYYKEQDEEKIQSLEILKSKLREKFPHQVTQYDCKVDREADGFVYMSGFEAMGQRVLTHFKKHLEFQYPIDNLGVEPSLEEVLKMEHETFMFQRSQVLLGRDDDVKKVMTYVQDEMKEQACFLVVGFPGAGKSALMAYTVKQCLSNPKYKVFYHFIGATPRSTDLFQILTRFFMEHMPTGTQMPEDIASMKRFSDTMFNTANERALAGGYERFIIFIDALNQMDDDGDAQYLGWLPKVLPKGMRIIVSTLEGKSLNAMRNAKVAPVELSVEPLGKDIRKKIAEKILSEYNKKLDGDQMEVLTEKAEAGRPLWLTVACEELRVFGEFRRLTSKIKDLPEDIIGLLELVLKRIVLEYGGNLVVATLCLVETSRFGLLENELLELLGMSPLIPGGQASNAAVIDGKVPMAKWALVYVGLRAFLRPTGSSGEGRLDFHHRTISKVVRKMYLSSKAEQRKWHQRLVDYFETCTDIERKAEELPYHQEMCEDKDRLKVTLLSRSMFEELYQESNKQQLMKYWRFIGGYEVASEAYVNSLQRYIQEGNLTDIDDIAPIETKVAWFLVDIGEYDTAMKLLKDIITKISQKHGDEAVQMANPCHAMVFLLYRKALKYVYGSHPGYRECRQQGNYYAPLCARIHKKKLKETDNELGHVLTVCGYFQSSPYLEDAKRIFETTGNNQGLAEVLYMLGEKNQYNSDLAVPIQYFTKSHTLCMATFGKFHLHTARACQLYGQMYWNNWTHNKRQDWLESCLPLYEQELEILAEILGPHHVTTVRSREDVIIILQSLGRDGDAATVQKNQPKHHGAL